MERSRTPGESLMVRRTEGGAVTMMVEGALQETRVPSKVNGHAPLWTLCTIGGDVTLGISR